MTNGRKKKLEWIKWKLLLNIEMHPYLMQKIKKFIHSEYFTHKYQFEASKRRFPSATVCWLRGRLTGTLNVSINDVNYWLLKLSQNNRLRFFIDSLHLLNTRFGLRIDFFETGGIKANCHNILNEMGLTIEFNFFFYSNFCHFV